MALDAELHHERPDRAVEVVGHGHAAEELLRPDHLPAQGVLLVHPCRDEGHGVRGERLPAPHDLGPAAAVAHRLDVHLEAEPVGDLRAQLPLLRVHRPDEQEAGRMGDGDPLALDDVDPERGRVEKDVRQVVVEQVDLVDVEDAPVRLGEQARLERLDALLERPGEVERARHAVLGRVQR